MTLLLGGQTYSDADLLNAVPPLSQDASVVLARQLAAVQLNAAAGSGGGAPQSWIDTAQSLLGATAGLLPQHISSLTAQGISMRSVAAILEAYNRRCGRAPVSIGVLSPTGLIGDVDGDCRVSIIDLTRIAGRFVASRGSPRFDPAYDLNGNGAIDVQDITLAALRFLQHC